MIAADGTAVYPWNHGETLTAAALNSAIATGGGAGPFLPLSGGTVTGPLSLTGLVNAANDAAAAAAGVAVNQIYRNGSVLMVRVS